MEAPPEMPKRQSAIRRSMRRIRKSFKKKDGYVPPASKPHQYARDEKAVRAADCNFSVKYLGAIEVTESRGMSVCEEAAKRLRANPQHKVRAVLQVSADALRVVEEDGQQSPPFGVAVDVGCGSGQGTKYLAPHFREVVGVDVSDGQLQEARKTTVEGNVIYRIGSGEDIPAPDSSVDLITCAQSMHWFDMEKFFTECNRVLKTNGCIAAYGNGIPLPCTPNQEIQKVMQEMFMEIYRGILGPYTDERRTHVANLYRDIHLPCKDFKRDTTLVKKNIVRVDDMLGFIQSLSSYQIYIKKFPDKADFLSGYRKRFLDTLQPLNPSIPAEDIKFDFVAPIFILLGRKS
ncbi:Numb-like protein [Holothuria leucospilota]|uniref:Numb-like protein n=1 Tax=Holothuria leucospilota TaxID=206669 RepID=A0A9Q1CGF1_HOLLE|nr:Numb-like protein [Holothuria leucospilota]